MTRYDPAAYGDRMAEVYDEWPGVPEGTEDEVSFLAELAGAGRALELGIGTGRRYAWPSELDLMARLAGLHLRERWGDWRREPFTAASTGHVSVYGRE